MRRRSARPGHLLEASLFITVLVIWLFTPVWAQVQAGPVRRRNVSFAPDVRLGAVPTFEPAMTANPALSGNLVAGFFDNPRDHDFLCRAAFTLDAGLTWNPAGPTPLQKSSDQCFDPSLAADSAGSVYYAYLDCVISRRGPCDLLVAKSTDGGRSFPRFSVAAHGSTSEIVDKPYIAVDVQPKSPFRGSIYASYDFLSVTSFGITAVTSRDGGSTWSAPVTIVPFGGTTISDGSLPVVAPDGTVYVFFASYTFRMGGLSIRFVKSIDGGMTWSLPASVASGLPSPGSFQLKNANPKFGQKDSAGILVLSWPTAAIAPDGTIFVAWIDFPQGSCGGPFGQSCINSDVRLAVSRDGGKSWSAPVKVSDETNASDQFFPWMATHPDGLLSIAWLDKRLDPLNENYDVFYTNTFDGATFLPNVRVSTATSIIGMNNFVGDYQGLAATADAVFPVWDDLRLGAVAIFTAKGTLTP